MKGSKLKNTDWVVGLVIYTGNDTKLMMNSQKVRNKQSKMERKMNRLVMYIVFAQACLCALIVLISSFWYHDASDEHYYLPF